MKRYQTRKQKHVKSKRGAKRVQTRRFRRGGGLNNSFNLTPENLENLHTVNTGTPEWNIEVGDKARNEKIPRSLEWRPTGVPKLKLPFPLMRQRAENVANAANTNVGFVTN